MTRDEFIEAIEKYIRIVQYECPRCSWSPKKLRTAYGNADDAIQLFKQGKVK